MESVVRELLTRQDVMMLLGGLLTITYAVVSFRFLTFTRERRTRQEQRFFKALDAGFTSGSLESLNDVVNIYKGVAGMSSEDLEYRTGLSRRLREYLVQVIERGTGEDGKPVQAPKASIISRLIAENDTASPHADLPDLERSIISDISEYLKSGNVGAVERKVEELSSAIQARENDLSRIRNTNRWSVPLAAVGLVLTVLFGLLSLLRW